MTDLKEAHKAKDENDIPAVKPEGDIPKHPISSSPVPVMHRSMASHIPAPFVAFLLIAVLAIGYLGGWLGSRSNNNSNSLSNYQAKQIITSTQGNIIRNIANTVGPSVVSIDVTTQSSASSPLSYFGFGPSNGSQQTQEQAGTGIILTSDGLIMTNRHVVPAGTTSVQVTLSDGTVYNDVKVIGRTSDNDSLDVAFVKIQNTNGHKLTVATLGDASQMQIGDQVVAIGNALGQFQNTVTSGIISGRGRSIQASDSTGTSSENLDDLFQTDAAINEGNSGGPLVNLSGQVIGMNTAIATSAQNIGFAIPMDDLIGLIKSVESTGKLERPYLGIIYVPVTPAVQQQYNLKVSNGAYIPSSSDAGQQTIVSGGPADSAGLKEGDVITAINGTNINQSTSLVSLLDKQTVGSTVTLTVNRGGQTLQIKATLGAAPTG